MADDRKRKLERDAAQGDEDAKRALERYAQRALDAGPLTHLVGKWVILNGVVQHWRGCLVGVSRVPSGYALMMHPLYEQEGYWVEDGACRPRDRWQEHTTEECPAVLLFESHTCIRMQDEGWPEHYFPE